MKNTKSGPPGFAHIHPGPIDWEAWMREASQPRGNKGKKRTPEQCAKLSAAQKARFAKQRAQMAEAMRLAREAEAARPKPDIYDPLAWVTVTDKVLGNMEPGGWYASLDMSRIAGVKYQACKAFAVKWWRDGILVRRQNPDWRPPERVGAKQEPKWLYSLTAEGVERHRLSAALL